ncbi:MAG: DNA-processing protein DprA [Cloacibacillus sp.]
MDERLKMYLLLNKANANISSAAKFLNLGAGPSELWRPSKIDAALSVLSAQLVAAVRKLEAENWAEREYERASQMGAAILTPESCGYPEKLTNLSDMPPILYVRGDINALSLRCVGVVGTRRAGRYGKEAAARIGAACADCGIAVVSGGAWGVDGTAQGACCENGGRSVAVLGTGVDIAYPASNKKLFDVICQNGALVSEFPLGASGEPWHFPRRNRIVAALSEKLIVVEAPVKSGSMITARLALELGVEVWALPGQIYDENAQGTNRLIYDGAYPYISDEVFFSSCGIEYSGVKKAAQSASVAKISPEGRQIIEYLSQNGPQTIDNLVLAVKMSAAGILKEMAILSANGLIYMSSPGRYSVKSSL